MGADVLFSISHRRSHPVASAITWPSRAERFSFPSSIAWIVGLLHPASSAIFFCVRPRKVRKTARVCLSFEGRIGMHSLVYKYMYYIYVLTPQAKSVGFYR